MRLGSRLSTGMRMRRPARRLRPRFVAACAAVGLGFAVHVPTPNPTVVTGIDKIDHVIIIMQENRSFDSYFGTYPGADGIPMQGGVPTVCLPDPLTNGCQRPYHDPSDMNRGGPHLARSARAVIDGGKMDGFIREVVEHPAK